MNEEDDKATVVLDLNKLKEELDNKKDNAKLIDQDVEINFSSSPESPQTESKNIVLYEAEGETILKELATEIEVENRLISELKELNTVIKEKNLNLIFFYGKNQKAVSAILKQINSTSLPINTILIAKNLSEAKASAHKQTPYAAKQYLSYPLVIEDLLNKCI